jgi:surface antigen
VNLVAAPGNDDFVNRTRISGSSANLTGTNVGATKEYREPNHAGNSGGTSVWWTWTAPSSGSVTIDTTGSNFNTLLAVYTGSSVSSLTAVTGGSNNDDPSGGTTSKVSFNAVAGRAYQIAVDGYNGASGTITLHLYLAVQPDFTLSAYRLNNPFWRAGFAPKSTNPPNPQLGNALGNCTWYANGRLRELGYSSADLDKLVGNASTWDNSARANGIPVSSIPGVGAIAQTDSGGGGQGHVAVVERVNTDGTIVISESSYAGNNPLPNDPWNFLWRTRTVSASTFQNYIYVRRT